MEVLQEKDFNILNSKNINVIPGPTRRLKECLFLVSWFTCKVLGYHGLVLQQFSCGSNRAQPQSQKMWYFRYFCVVEKGKLIYISCERIAFYISIIVGIGISAFYCDIYSKSHLH